MYDKLFSLRVPSGWAIVRHNFGDVDPIIEDGVIVNDEFYSEDLLSIEGLRFSESGWVADPEGYVLDLGWYPEANPKGCFCLTLLREDWDQVLLKRESQDRHKIHKLIEECFSLITQGATDDEIALQAAIWEKDLIAA